jgi:hypothetical protein
LRTVNVVAFIAMLAVACGSQVVQFANDQPSEAGVNPLPEAGMPETGMPDTSVSSDACKTQGCRYLPGPYLDASFDVVAETMPDVGVDAPNCNTVPGAVVNLGTAGNFAILAKSGISTVPASLITGNIGVSPIAASAITGFALTPCSGTCAFSTSAQVVGEVFAADYGAPTPANMTTAVSDMQTAFVDAAGRAPGVTELGAGNIGSMVLAPNTYKWSTGLLIPTSVTLQGGCGDVWIFEVAQDLTVSSGVQVILSGGALAKNVFWQVSGSTTLGTTVSFQGTILDQTAITMQTGASITGSLLAQTAVALQQSVVVKP